MPNVVTVTGITTPARLGKTLMHEHLAIGYPGWESHTTHPGPSRGMPIPDPTIATAMAVHWHPLHFTRRVVPQLREGGASEAQIDALLVDNPRRFFAGEKLPAIV